MPDHLVIPPNTLILVALMAMGVLSAILGSWAWLLLVLGSGKAVLPREARPVVPWGPLSVITLVLLYLALQVVVLVVYGPDRPAMEGEKPGPPPLADLLLLDAVAKLLMVMLTPAVLRVTSGARLADLGVVGRDFFKNIARGVWLCFLILPVVYAVMYVATQFVEPTSHPIEKAIRELKSPTIMLIAGLAAVVAAPVAEELLFRGVLLGWFWKIGLRSKREDEEVLVISDAQDERPGDVDPFAAAITATPVVVQTSVVADPYAGRWRHDLMANVAVSIIFAGLHAAQWPAPLPLFMLSLAMGEVYRRTGSLVAPIALHATFNGLNTAGMFLMS